MPIPDTRFRRLLDFIREPVLVVHVGGRVECANAAAAACLGADPVGSELTDFLEDPPERVLGYLRRCSGVGSPAVGALSIGRPGAREKRTVHGARFLPGANGSDPTVILRFAGPGTDDFSILARKLRELNQEVGHRRRLQAELEESLRHRDVLLDELHHRVKNQTQMLASMFSTAAAEAGPEARAILLRAHSRLLAMGAVQRLMYRAGRVDSVPARDFIAELCAAIGESWPPDVILSSRTDDVVLPNDHAVPLALILNELAANALEHGLRYESGRVVVSLLQQREDLVLSVWDSGGGWKEPTEIRTLSGLGLVKGLCRQIGGALDIEVDDGTRFTVGFPYRPPGGSHGA